MGKKIKKFYPWHEEPCHHCGNLFQLTRGDPLEVEESKELLCSDCIMYARGYDDGMSKTDGELRYPLRKFACIMEEKLRQNDYKGIEGWRGNNIHDLFTKMLEEVQELHQAIQTNRNVDEEAADVANMAMIIADVWRRG